MTNIHFLRRVRRNCRRSMLAALMVGSLIISRDAAGGAEEDEAIPTEGQDALTFDTLIARVGARTADKQRAASEELNRTRERIAAEKAPMLDRLRAAENRILAATSETRRLKTARENAGAERRRLLKEVDALRKGAVFATTTARDSLAALRDALPPGESKATLDTMNEILDRMNDATQTPETTRSLQAVELILSRVEGAMGGRTAEGEAIHAVTNTALRGRFAFVGPEVFFRSADGSVSGPVRQRDGSSFAVFYPSPTWGTADAARYFAGEFATIPADASGGKALRLQQTQGSIWSHIQKGGLMAFVILAVGAVALIMVLQKIRDVTTMRPEDPAKVDAFLAMVARNDFAGAEQLGAGFRGPTRELFKTGIHHRAAPKALLEEHLESVLLEQRLHFERRLPLLAVIATAAPLMGLLGTVVGMVKTFTLITVFGTGNAGKLSSGISEVLVATELGLAVAIPTLIVHGFLAHRIEKNLAQLERYALRFAIAAETARSRAASGQPLEAITA